MTAPDARDPADAPSLPRHTTPTWEVELLISGVAVFAMLQLPELLDRTILAWRPRLIERWGDLLWMVYVYAKSAALILAATFVIHLLMRARWIALVGMLSIYPRGVDWSRLRMGPIARDIESRQLGRMEDAIDRADNRATMVFALGVVMASILVGVTLVVTVVIAVAWWLDAQFGWNAHASWVAWIATGLMLPYLIAFQVDRSFGERLAPDGLAARIVRPVLGFYARIGMGMANNPALALLSSHRGQGWTIVLMVVVFTLATIAATTSYYVARNPDAVGSYDTFPDADDLPARAVDPAHYDDRRDPVRSRITPYLQSAVVIGPYLQLVVPWDPDRDGPAMQARCARLPADRQLACFVEHVRPMTLDGKPLVAALDIGEDARTNRPALVAMIDVRDLARGRHVLGIAVPPAAKDDRDDNDGKAAPDTDFIPFWR